MARDSVLSTIICTPGCYGISTIQLVTLGRVCAPLSAPWPSTICINKCSSVPKTGPSTSVKGVALRVVLSTRRDHTKPLFRYSLTSLYFHLFLHTHGSPIRYNYHASLACRFPESSYYYYYYHWLQLQFMRGVYFFGHIIPIGWLLLHHLLLRLFVSSGEGGRKKREWSIPGSIYCLINATITAICCHLRIIYYSHFLSCALRN